MPRGFTLLEVVVALGLGAVAVAAAAGLLGSLWSADLRVQRAHAEAEAQAHAAGMLSELFSMVLPATPGFRPIHGDASSLAMVTYARGAWGGLEQVRLELNLFRRGARTVVALRAEGEGSSELVSVSGSAVWQFLAIEPTTSTWTSEWRSDEDTPLAVRLVGETDTLTFAIGGHR